MAGGRSLTSTFIPQFYLLFSLFEDMGTGQFHTESTESTESAFAQVQSSRFQV